MRRREVEWQRRNPWSFAYAVVSAVGTAVTLIGWATHRHHPAATWWLVAGAGILALWACTEVLRFRHQVERHFSSVRNRLVFDQVHCADRQTPPGLHIGIRFVNKSAEPIQVKIIKLEVTVDGAGQQEPQFNTDWFVIAPDAGWFYWFPWFTGLRLQHGMKGTLDYELSYGHAEGAYRYRVTHGMDFECVMQLEQDGATWSFQAPVMDRSPARLTDLPATHLPWRRPRPSPAGQS
jgi:hypothetical protein